MTEWRTNIPTDGTVELPPDPRALDSLGRNHSLETALADLVDNSVDADAGEVLIRFVRRDDRLVGLYVVDDGGGIAPDAVDAAMTLGGRRDYGSGDLGLFGLGLKAASFSQADSLTLLSRAPGAEPVGRRWLLDRRRTGFHCDTVPADFARTELDRVWGLATTPSGTVVRWDQVRTFPANADGTLVDEFLGRTISHLQGHLGLMFHRMLADGRVRITIDVEDARYGPGLPHPVVALDPFGYPSTVAGWPKDLVAAHDGRKLHFDCHLWPGRSNLPQYRLPGGAESRQGLYFYRRDRLLQAGGWDGVHAPDRTLQLARVAVHIDGDLTGLFEMNPEKSRVSTTALFSRLVGTAHAADGTTMADYLQAAQTTWTNASRRATAKRKPVIPPGRGMHPKVSREIREELPQLGDEPLNLLWKQFPGDEFLEVDRDGRTLWLNQQYRRALLGGRRGGLNDLPMLKALLFLLTESVFEGSHLGARDKDNIDLWQSVLTAAAKADRDAYEARL